MVELVWKFLRFYVRSSEISTGEDSDFVFFFFFYYFVLLLFNEYILFTESSFLSCLHFITHSLIC